MVNGQICTCTFTTRPGVPRIFDFVISVAMYAFPLICNVHSSGLADAESILTCLGLNKRTKFQSEPRRTFPSIISEHQAHSIIIKLILVS